MADQTENVIINIELTNADYVNKADETVRKIEELKRQQQELKEAGQQNGTQWTANAQALSVLGRELRSYTTLAAAAGAAEQANADAAENASLAYTSETGSINELRARLSLLTAQRNAMSAADRDSSEAGRELTRETRELSDELKELERQVGDTRRNVGNYAEGMREVLADQIPFGSEIMASVSSFRAMTVSAYQAGGAMKVLKVALASTGIGLIILAVAALVQYLSSLEPVMDAIEVATAKVSAIFRIFGRTVFDVGAVIVKALSSPLQLIKDIGKFLADPIAGLKQLGEAAAVVGREMAEAARAAEELTKAIQDQEDADIEAISNTARLRLERDKLAVQAKNVSLSEEKRIQLLKQSSDFEKQAFEIENNNAKNRLKNLLEEQRQYLKNGQTKEADADRRKAIAEAEAEVYNMEAKSLAFTEKRYNDQAKLIEKQQAAEEKAAQAREKAREKEREADQEADRATAARGALFLTARQRELAELDQEINEKKDKYAKYNATVVALEKERIARIGELNRQYREEDEEQLTEQLNRATDLAVARMADQGDREVMQVAIKNQRLIDEQDKLIQSTRERVEKGEEGLTELLLSQERVRTELLTTRDQEVYEANQARDLERREAAQELLDREVERQQRATDAKIKIKDEELKNAEAGISLAQQIFDKETAIGKAAIVVEKGFAIARIIIKTQEALAANRVAEQLVNASLSAIPFIGAGLAAANSVKAAAERVRIIIGGAISGAAVAATVIQGFKDGVIDFQSDGMGSMVSGSGTGRSDSVNARLSNGESVINARSTSMFKPLLSAINAAGGGRRLDGSYSGSTFADGGVYFTGNNPGRAIDQEFAANNQIIDAIANMKIVVGVRDIIRESDTAIKAEVAQNI